MLLLIISVLQFFDNCFLIFDFTHYNFSEIIETANAILAQLTVPRRVKTIEDLNADMFITLYEGLCGESIPGKHRFSMG